jgi:hypothetical protein
MKKRIKKKVALRKMEALIPPGFVRYQRMSLARYRKIAKAREMPANMLVGRYDNVISYYDLTWRPYVWINTGVTYDATNIEYPPNRAPWSSETSRHFCKRCAEWWCDFMSRNIDALRGCNGYVWYDTTTAINDFVKSVVALSH